MVDGTKIEWADATFNPWIGCTKVSPACDHCYAEAWAKRVGNPHLWAGERQRTRPANWQQPHKWNKAAQESGIRRRVFCASLADVFDNQVPLRWRDDLWHLIEQTPHLDWLLLTKRPQNIAKMLPDPRTGVREWGNGWPNVWLGTTTENQEEADRRIPHLLATPAAKRFLSCEPLLGPVDLHNFRVCEHCGTVPARLWAGDPLCPPGFVWDHWQCPLSYDPNGGCDGRLRHGHGEGIDWVIAGSESGPGARPSHPDWFRSLRDQCAAAGTAFFFKQWGEWIPVIDRDRDDPDWRRDYTHEYNNCQQRDIAWLNLAGGVGFHGERFHVMRRVGKKAAGRLLDGREHSEMPNA